MILPKCQCGSLTFEPHTNGCQGLPASPASHFDPNPRKLEPSTNGFVWCDPCEAPVSVAGHECAIYRSGKP